MDHNFVEIMSDRYIDEYKRTTDVPLRKIQADTIIDKRISCSDFTNFFSVFGCVEECSIIYNDSHILSAHITFEKEEDAMKVLKHVVIWYNNNLRIKPVAYDQQPDSLQQLYLINYRCDLEFQNSPNYNENDLCNDTDKPFLNKLNADCLKYIFSLLPIIDKLRAGIVCKRWNALIQESWSTMRTLDFSPFTWGMSEKDISSISAEALDNVLLRCGKYLSEMNLKTDSNLRRETDLAYCSIPQIFRTYTLAVIGKHCPNLKKLDTGAIQLGQKDINYLIDTHLNLTTIILSLLGKPIEPIEPIEFSLQYFFKKVVALEYLQISKSYFPPLMGQFLQLLSRETMHTLIIEDCAVHDVYLSKALERLINLRDLRIIKCNRVNKLTMSVINNHCTNLRILKLKYLYGASMTEFKDTKLSNLEVLSITHNSHLTDDILLNIVQRCPKLIKINVKDCPVTMRRVSLIPIQYRIAVKFRFRLDD